MEVAISTNDLTALGALATAVFTGAGLVVTYLAYQHGRHQSARRRPIRLRRNFYFHDDIKMQELPPAIRDTRPQRATSLRFVNVSDVDIRWQVENRRTRLYGAAKKGTYHIEAPGVIDTRRHDGSTVGLQFILHEGEKWSSHETDPSFKFPILIRQKYWLRFRGTTADGQKIKGWTRVQLVRGTNSES